MKFVGITLVTGVVFAASGILSSLHPWGDLHSNPPKDTPLLQESTVPVEVRHVLEKKCEDCHSQNTHWPAYSKLAPVSWLMEHDVHEGRAHLDLSQWQKYDRESQIDLLTKIASEARSGQMPVKQYLILHPGARLSATERQLIYDWAKTERKRIKQQVPLPHDKPSTN